MPINGKSSNRSGIFAVMMKRKARLGRYFRLFRAITAAFTFIEVMIAFSLFLLLTLAVYRLFFSEVRAIKSVLEHLGVNENARLFLARFGNDVRNANIIRFPEPVSRDKVQELPPSGEGKFCSLETQVFDFSVQPPSPAFIKTIKVEWRLKKAEDGTYDVHRDVISEVPAFPGSPAPYKSTRLICGGIKELTIFSTIRRPVKFSSFPGLPFKSVIIFEPYDVDGAGPNLIHLRMTFIRQGKDRPTLKDESAHNIRTCFAVRGRLNGVNP